MTRKIVGANDPGDATHWGTTDADYINQYLTGVDQGSSDPVDINTTTKFRNNKLCVGNPSNSAKYIMGGLGITADRILTLPLLAGNATISTQGTQVIDVAVDGSAQYTDLTSAINAATPNTVIYVSPGTYLVSSTNLPVITTNNLTIVGSGVGVTIIAADTSVTGDTPLLDIHGAATGSSFAINNTAVGDTQVTTSTAANAGNFAAGQYILVRSNKVIDSEIAGVHAGEIALVTSVNASTGVITLRDEINDAYLTTDSASIIQIAPVSNISISGITFQSNAATSARTGGFISCRFLNNFRMTDCEVSKGWWASVQLSSCINSRVETSYFHDTQDPSGAGGSTHYGVVVHAASKNIVIDSCQFSTLRHSITMGGQSGTNFEGMVRSVTSTNNTSESADTAHFDSHQAAENIIWSSNTSIGGTPATGNTGVFGIQVRSPKTSIIGCSILRPKGKGIYCFGVAKDTVISGCTIDTCKQFNSAGGDAIYADTAIKGLTITGCQISNCEGHAFTGSGTNDDAVFDGNTVDNCCTVTTDGNVKLTANNIIVSNNRFKAGPNRPIQMVSTSDNWTIIGNDFTGMNNTAPAFVNSGSRAINNTGYNPVSPTTALTTPFATSGAGDIKNVAQSAAVPATNTDQTNRFTPKTIIISGGTYSGTGLLVNGTTISTTAGTFIFKLGIGEKFNVSYSVAPTISVFVE